MLNVDCRLQSVDWWGWYPLQIIHLVMQWANVFSAWHDWKISSSCPIKWHWEKSRIFAISVSRALIYHQYSNSAHQYSHHSKPSSVRALGPHFAWWIDAEKKIQKRSPLLTSFGIQKMGLFQFCCDWCRTKWEEGGGEGVGKKRHKWPKWTLKLIVYFCIGSFYTIGLQNLHPMRLIEVEVL